MPPAVIAAGILGGSAIAGGALAGRGGKAITPTAMFPSTQAPYAAGVTKAGQTGISTLQDLASGKGFQDIFQAMTEEKERGVQRGEADITEKFGSQGLRFSEPLMQGLVDYRSQVEKEYGSLLADLGLQAKKIQLGAAGDLAGMLQTAATSYYQPGYAPSSAPYAVGGIASLLASLMPYLATMGSSGAGGYTTPWSSTSTPGFQP